MEIKMFEIRDRATFLSVTAIKLGTSTNTKREDYLLRRMGFNLYGSDIQINSFKGCTHTDLYEWNDRTYQNAHKYIEDHWVELETGDVIDVEFILGETKTKKISEQFEDYI